MISSSSSASSTSSGSFSNFLVISDIHLEESSSHIMEINPTKGNSDNDLDFPTFQKLIATIHNHIQTGAIDKPQFIIILGDMVGHLRTSTDSVVKSESLVFSTLKNTFPLTPIFYVFGNNDSIQANYGPFHSPDQTKTQESPFEIAKTLGNWKNGFLSTGTKCEINNKLFPCILSENIQNGFYSARLKSKLRLISLNSVLFSPKRTLVAAQDASYQLEWLDKELNLAEKNNESVLIAMHIPPGMNVYDNSSFWLPDEQNKFISIIKSHSNHIIAILASHTHAEELKIIRDKSDKPLETIFFTAALSTSHGNVPSVKTFYLLKNNKKWRIDNYETYNFTDNQNNLTLNFLYDYKSYYGRENLTGNLADKMKRYFSAGNPNFSGVMKFPEDVSLPNGRGSE